MSQHYTQVNDFLQKLDDAIAAVADEKYSVARAIAHQLGEDGYTDYKYKVLNLITSAVYDRNREEWAYDEAKENELALEGALV